MVAGAIVDSAPALSLTTAGRGGRVQTISIATVWTSQPANLTGWPGCNGVSGRLVASFRPLHRIDFLTSKLFA